MLVAPDLIRKNGALDEKREVDLQHYSPPNDSSVCYSFITPASQAIIIAYKG